MRDWPRLGHGTVANTSGNSEGGRKNVVLVRGDTDTSTDVGSTSASRQTYISGRAVYEAASKLNSYLDKKGYYRGRTLADIYPEAQAEQNLIFDGFFD